MAALIERIGRDRQCVWIEYAAYAGKLLAGGAPPWLDVDAFIAWQRKAQGLLKSDVVALSAAEVAAAWIGTHPDLAAAMAAKRRVPFPLRTLLADEGLRGHLGDLLRGLRSSFANLPLALSLPSPRRATGRAYALAHGEDPDEVDDDAVDSAATYVADFLRAFAECGIDVLLFGESAGGAPRSAADVELYRPALNVGAHYRWDVGIRLPEPNGFGAVPGIDFWIAPQPIAAAAVGILVGDDFWHGGSAPVPPDGGFRFTEIPAQAEPESVLERLAALRRMET